MINNRDAGESEHRRELARLKAEVKALQSQLEKARRLATFGTMTAMVAHEVNNILSPIINYAQMAQKNPAFTSKAISKAHEGSRRAAGICQAILRATGRDAPLPVEANVAEIVNSSLDAMARDLARDGISLGLDIPAELTVPTRPVELQQVLLNLLLNARTAVLAKTAGGRRIDISARKTEKFVELNVRDSGIGISPDDMRMLFEPLFSTKDSGGHGLGLAFCRQIIGAMGGDIFAQSIHGRGATFTIHLPVNAGAGRSQKGKNTAKINRKAS